MLGFVQARLVLLSVPKTGSTALETALGATADIALKGRPEIKHLTLRQYQQRIAPLLAAIPGRPFRVIAVIREPTDWLGSWYRYRRRPQLEGQPNSTAGIDFARFVTDYLSPDQPPHARLGRQSGFLRPQPGGPPVDELFRYEDMPKLTAFLETTLGRPVTLARENVSPTAELALAPTLEHRLRDTLAEDYALWDGASRP